MVTTAKRKKKVENRSKKPLKHGPEWDKQAHEWGQTL